MRDHLGRFFAIMADRRSEYIGIGFTTQKRGDKPRWEYIPHSRADGIAAFHEYLGRQGHKATPVKTPARFKKPRFYAWPLIFLRSLGDKGPYGFEKVARFKKIREQFSGDHTPLVASHAVFSEAETRHIATAAAKFSVSVNSYLLSLIHPIVYAAMTNGDGPLVWFVPVDLRPWLPRYPREFNLFSALTVPLENSAIPATVHEDIRRMFSRQAHWYLWLKLRVASRLGLFERVAKRRRKTEFHLHEGKKLCFIFSNLGSWNVPRCQPVLFSPPPNIAAPAAIGAVTVNGRLALTLRVHPALQFSRKELKAILGKIRSSLLSLKTSVAVPRSR